jgi:SNF2 family DNA or RNA helicase
MFGRNRDNDHKEEHYEDERDVVEDLDSGKYIDYTLEQKLEQYEQKHNIGSGPDQDIDVPGLKVSLFPHQKTSVYMMERVERERYHRVDSSRELKTTMSIFGDMPGYGKTLSWLSLVARDKMDWDMSTDFKYQETVCRGSGSTYDLVQTITLKKLNSTLLIASTSLVGQWEKEIARTRLSCFVCTTRKKIVEVEPNQYDIVIVTPTMYNALIDRFQDYAWKRFGFDEAASTKITSMKTVYAGFYWFITATFPALDKITGRAHHFLKTVFKYMDLSIFNMMLIKNSNMYAASSFSMPKTVRVKHACRESSVAQLLSSILDDESKSMVMAGDVDGAIRHINGGIQEHNLVEVVLEKKYDELQKAQDHLRDAKKSNTRKSTRETREAVEKWTHKIEEIENVIKVIKERFNDALEGDCIICQDKLREPVLLSCCQNIYCKQCVSQLVNHSHSTPRCPMCRTDIVPQNIVVITGFGDIKKLEKRAQKGAKRAMAESEESESDNESEEEEVKKLVKKPVKGKTEEKELWGPHEVMSKPDTVAYILQRKPHGKFIVFSSHDKTFDLIRAKFRDIGIKCAEVRGTKAVRERNIQQYTEGDINVLFLNARFNGAGINLQNTTDIILYHKLPQHLLTQVEGRAKRIGRSQELTVHELE